MCVTSASTLVLLTRSTGLLSASRTFPYLFYACLPFPPDPSDLKLELGRSKDSSSLACIYQQH